MKLYLLTQSVNNGYDTYDSCVVAAKSSKHAKTLGPDNGWVQDRYVTAVCIGTARRGTKQGMICSSFNAG